MGNSGHETCACPGRSDQLGSAGHSTRKADQSGALACTCRKGASHPRRKARAGTGWEACIFYLKGSLGSRTKTATCWIRAACMPCACPAPPRSGQRRRAHGSGCPGVVCAKGPRLVRQWSALSEGLPASMSEVATDKQLARASKRSCMGGRSLIRRASLKGALGRLSSAPPPSGLREALVPRMNNSCADTSAHGRLHGRNRGVVQPLGESWALAGSLLREFGRSGEYLEAVVHGPGHNKAATWLILPVVICLSQRLSHACLSINCFIL